ncbi:MAG: hypothetical protein Tsb002_26720 [Wenzhouxiangellaceae bacterium]
MFQLIKCGSSILLLLFFCQAQAVTLNEIRSDQSGSDTNEYVELTGSPGESLNGLSLIAIGDGSGGSGVIESVVSLNGRSIPGDGYFVIAETSFTLGQRDLTATLNFENSDNVTHLLVRNFSGFNLQDLDSNNDGILDQQPWTALIDGVALVEQLNPPSSTEYEYASSLGLAVVGPDNGSVPGHAARGPDGHGSWHIGQFGSFSDDTPGAANTPFGGVSVSLIINEVRIDQDGPDNDEYLELLATPGASLAGYTLITIGDGAGGSGTIEHAIDLSPITVPGDGFVVIGEPTMTLTTPDLGVSLNFENGDNLTHLVVRDFFSSTGADLDTNNDGVLDLTPWSDIADGVAMVLQLNPPTTTEYEYATVLGFDAVGPDGSFVPAHIARRPDSAGVWQIGQFGSLAQDTPGTGNADFGSGNDYYAGVDASTPSLLRATLHALIDDHTWHPYTSSATDTWDILELADEDPANPGRVLDVYKNASYAKAGGGNSFYNREHTWPKSYGFPNLTDFNYPYTDTHMLYLADISHNSDRANKPFAQCNSGCTELTTQFNDGMGGGSGGFPGQSNWTTGDFSAGTWQTWSGRKGDVARAVLYMDIRYEGGSHGITGHAEPDLILTDNRSLIQNSSGNASVAYMGLLSTLLQWHQQDPPDTREQLRNEVIFSFQGNRNPFIDHPEWALCLFAGQCP